MDDIRDFLKSFLRSQASDDPRLSDEQKANLVRDFLPEQFCSAPTEIEEIDDESYGIRTYLKIPGLKEKLYWKLHSIESDVKGVEWALSISIGGSYFITQRYCHVSCMLGSDGRKLRVASLEGLRAFVEAHNSLEEEHDF